MKKILFSLVALAFMFSAASCGSSAKMIKQDTEDVSYTLKNKKEIVADNILKTKSKKVYATP